MPRLDRLRSRRRAEGAGALPERSSVAPEPPKAEEKPEPLPLGAYPYHERTIACPLCTRRVRPAVVADGPHETNARVRGWGAGSRMTWSEPEPVSLDELKMLEQAVRILYRNIQGELEARQGSA